MNEKSLNAFSTVYSIFIELSVKERTISSHDLANFALSFGSKLHFQTSPNLPNSYSSAHITNLQVVKYVTILFIVLVLFSFVSLMIEASRETVVREIK